MPNSEQYKAEKKELDRIRQVEYYKEHRDEIIGKITAKRNIDKPEQPRFKFVREKVTLYF